MIKSVCHIPIFLASDNHYAPFVATTIASTCHNTKSFLDFYILDAGISPFSKRLTLTLQEKFKNCSIEFIDVDIEKIFKGFKYTANIFSLSMYSRFLIPQIKPNLGKVLYFDVDVIALDDIESMYEHDLSGNSIAAVYQAYYDKDKITSKYLHDRMHLSNTHKYFNSGTLVIDSEKWRKKDIGDKLFSIAHQYNARALGDQDILNKCFENNYKQLDYKFNFTTQSCDFFVKNNKAEYSRLMREVVVRHFETPSKPWLTDVFYEGRPLENFHDFWFFAAMTPFYHGLQQKFLASRARNEVFSHEIIGNIIKPDKHMLNNLRAKMNASKGQSS